MTPSKTLLSILPLTLIILVMILVTPIYSQVNIISIYIDGGSGNCHFKEGDGEYGWTWCPTSPISGNYISCECVNIGGAIYSLYKLLNNVNAVITITASNIILDGQNKLVDGNNYSGNGISVIHASNVVVGNITVRRFQGAGIYVDQGSNYVIRFNTLELNRIGISIGGGVGNVQVINNNIRGNSIGVSVNHSSVTLCLNNFINNNNDVLIGVDWVSAAWHCLVDGKLVGNHWDKLSDFNNCRNIGDDDGLCRIINSNNIDRHAVASILPVPIPEPLIIPLVVLLVISLFAILSQKNRLIQLI